MLKIGELSKVCRVSVQTLRYYDRIGVLCADYTDDATGYRYYHPEKVKTFQMIEQLKTLDFSLDEIKEFLGASSAEQCRMYRNQKTKILDGIQKKREQIKQIDSLCENPQKGLLPLNTQILHMSFEDDPRVIGKWEYCGNLDPSRSFDGEEGLTKKEVLQDHLYFLPGGENVWVYFWTKGRLYYLLHEFNVIVPNEYRIFRSNNETYMAIDWMVDKFTNSISADDIRIYRQVDTHAYTERETYAFRDDVNVPYVPDECVLGEWETVDYVRNLDQFRSDRRYWPEESLWIVGMIFFNRGLCYKILRHNGVKLDKSFKYSAGVVLDEAWEHVEHYQIRRENDTDFLFVEHKSADYSYTGKIGYYVFRRKTQ